MISRKLLILLIFCTDACSEPDNLSFCSDPIGTDLYWAGNNNVICFQPDGDACFVFRSGSPSIINSVSFQGGTGGTIVDVGQIRCLGDITERPPSGYSTTVAAQVNHGYVVKFADNTYGRFFIVSVEKNSQGQITKVNLARQYDF